MSSSKTKKWLKRLGIGFGVFLLVFVGAALAIPYLFKDKILATTKSYINQNLNATVDFKDVRLSLLWTFPQFSFHLDGLTVTGKDEFEGMKLAEMQRFSVRLNLWSVIRGDYTVQGIVLDKPKLYVKVLNNGKANYDIAKADTAATKTDTSKTTEASGDFKVRLQYYAINNADVIYDDNSSNMYVELKNLSHSGTADFTSSKYDLYTKTSIEAFTVVMDRISYLRKAKIAVDFNANVDMAAMKFTLLKNSFKVNDLQLNAEGWLAMPKDDIEMDLKFSSPATSFAAVLSLVPGAYTKDFEGVKTGGSFSFGAFAKGIYNEKAMPAFGLDLNVANAHFQYPSLPLGVKDINTSVKINSPSSNLDQMTINVSKFQMLLGANPFSMRLNLKTPLSDPDVDAEIKGKIDLADLAKAFPMQGVKELSGLIEANLSTQTRLSYVSNAQYDKVKMDGALKISNMNYNAEGTVPTKIEVMQMDFSPNHVNLEQFKLKMGRSDVQAQGKLDNILTYFTRDKVMTGNLVVRSSFLDLNEIMGTDTSSSTDPQAATNMTDTTTAASTGEVFDRFKFGLDADFKRIIYDVYQLQDLKAVGSFSPTLAEMNQFDLLIGKVDMQAKGRLENVFGYLFDGELLKGDFSFNSNYMNLNQFMSSDGKATEPAPTPAPEDPSKAPAPYEPIAIPNNLDLRFTASMATLIYDTYKLRNVQTEILVRNQKAQIINLSCETMGGRMAFNGEYDTKDPVKPKFAFGYDLAKLEIVEVAKTAGIVQYFLPIAKSMTGRFDSKFKITGFLDKNLYPVLSSINSDGYLITYDAMLKGLALTKGLSEKVGAKDLETLVLTDTKNFFKIKDGKFELQPANFRYKDIDMILNGQHSLGGDGKYQMKMRVPKAMLQRSGTGAAVSNAAGAGFSALKGEASKLGVNLEQPDVQFVNLAVEMTGSLLQPKFAVKFLGAEGKGGESIGNQVGTTLKEEANKLKAEADAKVKEAEDKARAEADRLKNEAEAKAKAEADRIKAEAEAKAKAEAQRLLQGNQPNLNNVVNKDSLKNKTQGTIQDAKDKLKVDPNKIKNPFKRN